MSTDAEFVNDHNPDLDKYVIGVDYGTLSGRALVVRVSDGAELGSAGARVRQRGDRANPTGGRGHAAAGLGLAGP